MLTEDEALSWFKSSPGSSRIDFLCRVLRFCSPLELRYLAVVLEDVCRKDHHELQNIEHQLNNVVAFSSLAEAVDSGLSLLDKATRHKLLTALALLRSDNRSIGEKLFDVLLHSLEPNGTLKEDAIVYEEALLLLLMAANHPAFRFDHRKRLWQRIEQFSKGSTVSRDASRAVRSLLRLSRRPTKRNPSRVAPHRKVSPPLECFPLVRSSKTRGNVSPSDAMARNDRRDGNSKAIGAEKRLRVHYGGKGAWAWQGGSDWYKSPRQRSRAFLYLSFIGILCSKVQWSDGSTSIVSKTYLELFDFQHKVFFYARALGILGGWVIYAYLASQCFSGGRGAGE